MSSSVIYKSVNITRRVDFICKLLLFYPCELIVTWSTWQYFLCLTKTWCTPCPSAKQSGSRCCQQSTLLLSLLCRKMPLVQIHHNMHLVVLFLFHKAFIYQSPLTDSVFLLEHYILFIEIFSNLVPFFGPLSFIKKIRYISGFRSSMKVNTWIFHLIYLSSFFHNSFLPFKSTFCFSAPSGGFSAF